MSNILIISGHPRISRSIANRLIIEHLIHMQGVSVCDIMTNYPGGEINVSEEQSLLRNADLVILQFPFIWYGMPSHMKAWLEKVFSYGFAFGPGGDQLKNKKVLLSVTLGSSAEAYSAKGHHLHPVETFLLPIELFVKYCKMEYLTPVYSYEMVVGPGNSEEVVEQKAKHHAQRLKKMIALHSVNGHLASPAMAI